MTEPEPIARAEALDRAARTIAVLGLHGGRPPAGTEPLLARATLVAGGRVALEALAPPGARRVALAGGLAPALDALAAHDGPACVLASGDPGLFGIVRALGERVGPERLDVRPAPSSVALAFARLGLPWDDARVVSGHGRDPRRALAVALRHPKVAILTDPATPPPWYARRLGGAVRLAVAERLGTPDERLVEGTPEQIAAGTFADPNVLLVLAPDRAGEAAGWALPEAAFEHRAGMVTKAEVRALALAWLGPRAGDLVWDVGCGCGSVAIECARLGAAAIAIDRDPAAVALTERNAATHDVPLHTVAGEAPAALRDLPDPDAAFVGGGGPALIDACAARARRTVVATLALVERAGPALERLRAAGLEADATLLQASRLRPLAGGHRLAAESPIVVLRGVRR